MTISSTLALPAARMIAPCGSMVSFTVRPRWSDWPVAHTRVFSIMLDYHRQRGLGPASASKSTTYCNLGRGPCSPLPTQQREQLADRIFPWRSGRTVAQGGEGFFRGRSDDTADLGQDHSPANAMTEAVDDVPQLLADFLWPLPESTAKARILSHSPKSHRGSCLRDWHLHGRSFSLIQCHQSGA